MIPAGDLAAIEAHHDDGIGAALLGFADHAVDGVSARRLQHRRLLVNLADDQSLEAGKDVADETTTSDRDAEDLAKHL